MADGAGGLIVAWEDTRATWVTDYASTTFDIYIQRLDGSGHPVWIPDGIGVGTAFSGLSTVNQHRPTLTTDGQGGAIVAWLDDRLNGGDVYAQRIAADGTVSWQGNGVAVRTFTTPKDYVDIATDGAGGAIVTWEEGYSVRAQRVRSNGTLAWPAEGVLLADLPYPGRAMMPRIAPDGSGGAFIVWADSRVPGAAFYAQRLNVDGSAAWVQNGVLVAEYGSAQQDQVQIMADGHGGAILVWTDGRSGPNDPNIFAQRLDAAGAASWTPGGLAICTRASQQDYPVLATDGAGGAIFVWQDAGFTPFDQWAVAQHVDAGGTVRWAMNGVAVANQSAAVPQTTSNGMGGVFVVWGGASPEGWPAVYAQNIDAMGQPLWTPAGYEVYRQPMGHLGFDPKLVNDGAGGLITHWSDYRFTAENGSKRFAQRISDRVAPEPSTPADLSVILTASPDPVAVGGNLTYVAVVANAGPGPAPLVAFNSPIPPGTRLYKITTSQGTCATEGLLINIVSCYLGTIPAGSISRVTFVVRSGTNVGSLSDTAFVASNAIDPVEANNQATLLTTMLPGDAPPSTSFFTLTPCRILDTRDPNYGIPAFQSGRNIVFPLVNHCGIPPTTISVSLNVTVTQATGSGFLNLYPFGARVPIASTINYLPQQTRGNNVIVGLSDEPGYRGFLAVNVGPPASGTVHVILDVNGYFE